VIGFYLHDGQGKGRSAHITHRGELAVAPIEYSEFYNVQMIINNTAYNIVKPKAGYRFVITVIDIYGNNGIGANDSTVVIYEATSTTSTTVEKTIYTREVPARGSVTLSGLQVIIRPGYFLNAKMDDNNVYVNVAGYYVIDGEKA